MLLAGWCGLTYFLKVQSHQLLDIVLGSMKWNQYFLWNRYRFLNFLILQFLWYINISSNVFCIFCGPKTFCFCSPLPPLRGQPSVRTMPDGSPSKDWQSTVGWGDGWIQTRDCRKQSGVATSEPPPLPWVTTTTINIASMKSLGLRVFKFAVTEEFPEAPSTQMNWFQKAAGNCRQNLWKKLWIPMALKTLNHNYLLSETFLW